MRKLVIWMAVLSYFCLAWLAGSRTAQAAQSSSQGGCAFQSFTFTDPDTQFRIQSGSGERL